MRFVTKVFLVVSFILSFLVLLICITVKFQALDSRFWINTFRENKVYDKIGDKLGSLVSTQLQAQGAPKKEAQQVANLLSQKNLQNLLEKNTVNVLDFINGKASFLAIYIPIDQIPSDIRTTLNLTSDETSINKLISAFGENQSPIGEEVFVQLKTLGSYITASLITAVLSLIINLYFLYRMDTPGKKLHLVGISLILSTATSLVVVLYINSWTSNLAKGLPANQNDPSALLFNTLAQPIILKIVSLWVIISIITAVVGGVCFLIKKPGPGSVPAKL